MPPASATPRPAQRGRRTVVIRGQVAPPRRRRDAPGASMSYPRRPPRRMYERLGSRPDRIAMYAVLLGILLVLVAALSAHG
jgi:hypothetical protein